MKREVLASALSRGLALVVGVATAIITARTLGVDGRGEYFYIVTIGLLATQLANGGLSSSNTFLAARLRGDVPILLVNSLWVSLLAAPLAAVGVSYAASRISAAPTQLLILTSWTVLLAPAALFYLLTSNLLIGIQDFTRHNAIIVATSIVRLLLFIAAALYWGTVHAFLAVLVLTTIGSCIATGVALTRNAIPVDSLWPSTPMLGRSMGLASRAFLTLLLAYLLSRMPVIALGFNGDTHSVGVVSVVLQILDVLAILPASVGMVLFPKLVSGTESEGIKRTLWALVWTLATMLLACGLLAVISVPLVRILFGDEFAAASEALRWALPGAIFLAMAGVLGQYLAAGGFPLSSVAAWVLAAGVGYAFSPNVPGPGAPPDATKALSYSYLVLAGSMAVLAALRMRGCRAAGRK